MRVQSVVILSDLVDFMTGEYFTGEVNVTHDVRLSGIAKLPVKFGTVGGDFYCHYNQLATLEGAPSSVGGNFFCYSNQLTSLEGIHKIIKVISGAFYCFNNPIKSGGIGLILIEGLKKIYADQPAFKIIEKYLGQGKKGVLLCQDELIEAGYEEYARL
jgi:hypothetical protein